MTSLKTKNICFLAAFLFLSIVPTLAKVVDSVSECKQFLNQGTPPDIPGVLVNGAIQDQNRYKVICQTFKNVPRFLTVYDINNRIPVFSAYEFRGSVAGKPKITWKIEPQLEDNMMKEVSNCINQAMSVDYTQDKNYNRGHLFPVGHASSEDEQTSTCTLTNAVPQQKDFNGGKWGDNEECIKNIMSELINKQIRCFVVVGAQPGDNYLNNIASSNLRRVNIPSVMWSAFYCTDETSGAYWGNNAAGSTLNTGSLQDLKNSLGVEPFPGTSPKVFDLGKSCLIQ